MQEAVTESAFIHHGQLFGHWKYFEDLKFVKVTSETTGIITLET
jgi:hypothetical protein